MQCTPYVRCDGTMIPRFAAMMATCATTWETLVPSTNYPAITKKKTPYAYHTSTRTAAAVVLYSIYGDSVYLYVK